MSSEYTYIGDKAKFDQSVTFLVQQQGLKVTDITDELHQIDNTANMMNGHTIWLRRLRHYGGKVTYAPKHVFVFRHSCSLETLGTEGMFDAVMSKGGKRNPGIRSFLQGGTLTAAQMWTFALITQRDIFFVTDDVEEALLAELVLSIDHVSETQTTITEKAEGTNEI